MLSSLSDMKKIFLVKSKFMTTIYSNTSVLMGIGKKGKSNLKFNSFNSNISTLYRSITFHCSSLEICLLCIWGLIGWQKDLEINPSSSISKLDEYACIILQVSLLSLEWRWSYSTCHVGVRIKLLTTHEELTLLSRKVTL